MRSVPAPEGRTLAVREAGDPGGLPVLVLHGTPGSSILSQSHVRDAEQRGIRLVSYARPGYEGSSRNAGRSVADGAEDVAAVCDTLGIESCCVWGFSGGGPHALAAAALLPDRVAAVAALVSVAPFDADGLDFFAGMGEANVRDFRIAVAGGEPHVAGLASQRAELLAAGPEELVAMWETLLGPADREVATAGLAAAVLARLCAGIEPGIDGWVDDERAFTRPWGFELEAIRVPVLLWQGEQDRMVPPAHGRWLAERIPGVEARFTADDGHLTLTERRIPEVHAWLLERARLNGDA
jgi:pimeloyl-ACP methyl ester carboxylesterase